MTKWERSRKSWTVNQNYKGSSSSTYERSSWEKLKLLLWKNYTIQMRHKAQTILELLLPLLFTIILVVIRMILKSDLVAEPTIYPSFSLEDNPPYTTLLKCDRIFYTPSNNVTDALMKRVEKDFFYDQGFEYNFTGFASEQELLDAYDAAGLDIGITDNYDVADFDTTIPVLAGIIFENNFTNGKFPEHIEYRLRFPAGLRSDFDIIEEKFGLKATWFTEIVYPLFQLLGPRARNKTTGGLPGYYDEGFLYIQYAIDRSLIRTLTNSTSDELKQIEKQKVKLQRFPYPTYTNDKYLFALQAFLPLLMLLSFIYPVINITKSIVYEKEKRLKESMKMMGLSNWLHWTAWFIKSMVFLMISCLIMTILVKVRLTESQSLPIVPNTDGTLLYFIFLVFSFSAICFCFFMSTLFSQANTAATGAGFFWILFYVPYAFLQPRYNLLPHYVKIIACIMTNTPISFACQIICMFEGTGDGLQWSTLNEGSSPDDNFSMGWALLMMLINGTVYMLLAFYIEAVWPGEYGIPLPYNFFLKKWYWSGSSRYEFDFELDPPNVQSNANVEPSARHLKPGIQIKGLTKKFGHKTAVNKLYLDMHQGQITALLGHNGAGKTTTISILTGLFPPSSGTAVINGYDIHRDMSAIRSSLGICPQHDVLFDELTVSEHLDFFCLLKGMEEHLVAPEINRLLAALGLENKRHAKSRTLSGGMKRKLSVLIAFCANSKIVLLDECTSGMDLGSRRSTWDLIQGEKKGRTIILSTHFMEEADVLGDRIAIMADGELQCCGSSLFLKKRHGGGYHLIIVKNPHCVVDAITNLLQEKIPEADIDQNVGAELSYCLPDSQSHLFPAIFKELENRKDELGIGSYGASITTMEEVFMKVLKEADAAKSAKSTDNLDLVRNTSAVDIHSLERLKSDSKSVLFRKDPIKRNTGATLLMQQFWAMIMKKLLYAYRNRTLLIAQMLIPMFYLVVMFLCLLVLPGFHDASPFDVSTLERYESNGKTTTMVNCANTSSVCNAYKDYVSENFEVESIEGNKTFSDYILELAEKELTLVNFHYIVAYEERLNAKDNSTELIGYFNNQPFHGPPLTLNFITNALLKNSGYTVKASNHPLPFSKLDDLKEAGGVLTIGFQVGYNLAIAISFLSSTFIVFLVRERETGCKHLQFVSGVRMLLFWISNFIVDFINFIIPCFGLLAILVLFKMPEFTPPNMQFNFMLLMSIFGATIIPLVYLCSFLATNPTTGFSRLVVVIVFTGIAPMITLVFVSLPELQLQELVITLNKYFLIFPNYAMGMGIVQLSTNYQLQQICSHFNLDFLCSAYPDSYCCKNMKQDYLDWERMGIGRNLVYMGASCCIFFVLLFLVELKVFSKIYNCFTTTKDILDDNDSDMEDAIGLEDSDVHVEDDILRKTDLQKLFKSHNVVVRDLTKKYNNLVAVDQINFGVQPGECFGLLGVNGAGKTTTFKQLTGDISATHGDAFICGKSVKKQLREVHQNIGYTPQFDGLIDEMTGRETIWMFARLRGIPEGLIDDLVAELGDVLMFSEHLEKQVCQLSGGNKRKLSTACALVGKPSVVLLDEPSSGMDPVARRHLWNAVSMIRDAGTSIVLTTHSLEEAESLCTRLAIMVNGKFRCLGSPQHLKNKFSKGYTLIAQTLAKMTDENEPFTRSMEEQGRRRSSIRKRSSFTRNSNKSKSPVHWETGLEDLRDFIEESFPGCILKDIHPGFVHYHVMPSEETNWGKMFSIMEEAKLKFNLEAYSVGQTSLEQVFLNFTKSQINIEDNIVVKKRGGCGCFSKLCCADHS